MKYKLSSAVYILRDEDRRILLQHRDKNTKRFPDHWGFFGGKIEQAENPEEAVRREAKEELEIELKGLKFYKRYEFRKQKEEEFVFTAPLTIPLAQLKKQQKEGNDLGLFSFEELKNLKTPKFERVVLEDLFGKKF